MSCNLGLYGVESPSGEACRPCLHFVGFRDDAFNRAIKVFGSPDFVHRSWDLRATADVMAGDTVIFARDLDWKRFETNQPKAISSNDSEHF